MTRGLLETFGLAGSVLFAAPVALLGGELLLETAYLSGLGYLTVAVLMIVVPRALLTPGDVLTDSVERVVGWVVETDDQD